MKKNGFTLIELVMVIIILGILAAVAIPKFFDLQDKAKESAELGVVGSVRAGIHNFYANDAANNPGEETSAHWPGNLETVETVGACSTSKPCFDAVLSQGVSSDWTEVAANVYLGPAGNYYAYTPSTGDFQQTTYTP